MLCRFQKLVSPTVMYSNIVRAQAQRAGDARWVPPKVNNININFDVALEATQGGGFAFVARDEECLPLTLGCKPVIRASSPLMDEVLCFWWAT